MVKKNKLIKAPDMKMWEEIAYALAVDPEVNDVSDVAKRWELSKRDALQIVAHPSFVSFFHEFQIQLARHNFDLKAFRRIDDIIAHGKDTTALRAIKLGAELVDYRDSAPNVQVNLSVDKILRQLDKEQAEEPVIDAEVVDEEEGEYPGF
jgi:hypothetical protein